MGVRHERPVGVIGWMCVSQPVMIAATDNAMRERLLSKPAIK